MSLSRPGREGRSRSSARPGLGAVELPRRGYERTEIPAEDIQHGAGQSAPGVATVEEAPYRVARYAELFGRAPLTMAPCVGAHVVTDQADRLRRS